MRLATSGQYLKVATSWQYMTRLGEKKTLQEVFALIDTAEVKQIVKKSRITDDKIPQKIKKIIVRKDLPERITNSFKKRLAI